MPFLPNEKFTEHFSLYDLMRTDQPADNSPSNAEYNNMRWLLAPLLEDIYNQVGPFSIISAYRSPEVNRMVGGSPTSNHLDGIAADIRPLRTSPTDFWRKIYKNSSLQKRVGELALKPSNVHISVRESGKYFRPLIQEYGTYRVLSQNEIQEIVSGVNIVAATGPSPVVYASAGIALIFAAGLITYRLKNRTKQS